MRPDPAPLVAPLVAATWAVLGIAALRESVPIPYAPVVFLLAPAVAAALVLVQRRRVPRPVVAAVAAAAVAAGAMLGAIVAETNPLVVLGVPAALAAGVVVGRWPVAAMVALIAVSGIVGTVEAYTGLAPAYLVDAPLAGLIVCVGWRAMAGPGRPAGAVPLGLAAAGLFILASAGQTLASPAVQVAQQAFHNSAWHMVALPAIALAGWTLATRTAIARGFLVVAAAVSGYAVLRLIIGPAAAEKEQALLLAPINILSNGDLGLFGSTVSRQQLAAFCGMAIPFAATAALVCRGRWRGVSLAAGALSAVALIGTQTRVGLVGALAGLAVVLLLHSAGRAYPGLRLGGATVCAALVLLGLAAGFAVTEGNGEDVKDRYTVLANPHGDPSFNAHLTTWGYTLDEIERKPGGFGLGTAGGVGRMEAMRSASGSPALGANALDNSYLKVGYEQGVLMMLLFAAAVLLTFGALWRLGLRDRADAWLAIAACGAFASFAVNLFFTDNVEDYTAITAWVLAGVGVAGLLSPTGDSRSEQP
jgi:hypothetical protein